MTAPSVVGRLAEAFRGIGMPVGYSWHGRGRQRAVSLVEMPPDEHDRYPVLRIADVTGRLEPVEGGGP